ncbi:GAF domain-containing protein [Saccharothrix tamanrassetensis]|uniref:GAF domain-containing protein n=1 Tax=Saccharothrix tamanrassetensis TaxID=1051531 RepID=A0A841CKD6_9PSEU|nr:GAF and ANTAR domain-containing protein [Saccharothrix tamanrassetensis]MBB5957981.1 GAF domain-containing protein [Saccharothrix tamanrassetensis]
MADKPSSGSRKENRRLTVVEDRNHYDDLAAHLSELARTLHQQAGTQDTFDEIVRAAVETVPGAQHAGLMTVVGKHEVQTVSTTDALPGEVDQAQFDTGQGPCLDALFKDKIVSMPDVSRETRWPAFTERAGLLKVSSMLSFQLFVQDDDLGALNLYSPEVEAFDEESRHIGSLFAGHAAVALAAAQEREHLTEAMRTRDLIGQAKGILMERHKLTGDQAFTLLMRASQRANIKLRDLAEKLVHTGELTPPSHNAR